MERVTRKTGRAVTVNVYFSGTFYLPVRCSIVGMQNYGFRNAAACEGIFFFSNNTRLVGQSLEQQLRSSEQACCIRLWMRV